MKSEAFMKRNYEIASEEMEEKFLNEVVCARIKVFHSFELKLLGGLAEVSMNQMKFSINCNYKTCGFSRTLDEVQRFL
jgi:hypothetical protein